MYIYRTTPALLPFNARPRQATSEQDVRGISRHAFPMTLKQQAFRQVEALTGRAVRQLVEDASVRPTFCFGKSCDPIDVLAEQRNSEGHSLLYRAVSKEEPQLIECFLKTTSASLSAFALSTGENDDQNSLLLLAVNRSDEKVVDLLLEKGADINCRDRSGRTPLFRAVSDGNKKIARLLLDKGADIDVEDGSARTPLFRAVEQNDSDMASILLEHGAKTTCQNSYGQSLLSLAVRNGNEDIVCLILEKNIETGFRDEYERTVLTRAITGGQKRILQLLQKKEESRA